ncbi:lipopolysaccharide biosynthesis protein [Nostocoides jenkinsii]|uniref:Polysaccharide biosynthesis protein C-terminal domain-containing protein n=1 Tax=Nostocoides jenkinsii Ben 74 TaxID=1193518 RepID=A0A077MBI5_9MICO|nr:oligosaccharide flippase family protein [Tetrasphaera jenkinsii]CCI52013.1 membrane hypothetical protein [Tetrasphaera jenkinsii Ben 74]
MSQRFGGAALGYLTIALAAVVNLVTMPIILRSLGQTEFGIYSLVFAAANLLGLVGAGFNAAYLRFYWHGTVEGLREASINRVFATLLVVTGGIVAIVGLLLSPFAPSLLGGSGSGPQATLVRELWLLMVLTVALSIPMNLFDTYLLAKDNIVANKVVAMVRQVVAPLLFVPAVLAGAGSLGMAVVTFGLYGVTSAWTLWRCVHHLGFRVAREFDRSLALAVGGFSSFLLLNTLIDQVNWTADKILLSWTSGVSEVAVYSLGAQVNFYFMMLSVSLLAVFTPLVHELVARRDQASLGSRVTALARIQAMSLALVLLTFVFWGKPLMIAWVGPAYAESYTVAAVLMAGGFIAFVQNVAIEVQKARNLHRFRILLLAGASLLNVAISVQLSQHLGARGAALGTAIILVVANGLAIGVYSQVRVGVDLISAWRAVGRTVWAPVVLSAATALACRHLFAESLVYALVGAGVTVLTYVTVTWWVGMSGDERSGFRALVMSRWV